MEVTDLRWVYWSGGMRSHSDPSTHYKGPPPSGDIIQGQVWVVVTDDHRPRTLITTEVNLTGTRAALPPR